jgi:hypothetical protein
MPARLDRLDRGDTPLIHLGPPLVGYDVGEPRDRFALDEAPDWKFEREVDVG